MKLIFESAKKIKLLILDVDGVLTDGKVYFDHAGNESKSFNTQDGLGMVALLRSGVEIAIITGRKSSVVTKRMAELGVKHVFQAAKDKTACYEELLDTLKLNDEEIAYVGDDLPDLPLIRRVGLGIAVANSMHYLFQHADWKTKATGGNGAVREVCDLIMQSQLTLEPWINAHL